MALVTVTSYLLKLTAVTLPLNNAFDAVISPEAFTLKLLELIKKPFPVAEPDKKNPEPVIASRVIAKPPMLPVVAFMFPVTLTDPLNNADDAVTSPFASTLNFGSSDPPNMIVPAFRFNSDPSVVLKLFDRILPVVIDAPSILVLPPVDVLDNRD